ncbi:RNA polymerase factor sigma-54, partial [Turicimonas muris]
RPTSRFSNPEINFVLPEIKVEKVKGKWKPKLIRNAPKISLNRMYADAFSSTQTERDTKIWQGRLEEARQFIKSVEQRQTTLLNVSELIVNRQRDFFETGPEKLKPLVLREIADELGIHESTVSRITTGKYLICSRGTFELKYFFSSSHFAAGKSDEEVSASAIKAELKKIILGENPAKPLSDAKLSQLLEQKGFTVARRTVAKYREALGLPPASLRKRC